MICYTLLYKHCIALIYMQDTQVNTFVIQPLYNICIDTIYIAMYNGMYINVMHECITHDSPVYITCITVLSLLFYCITVRITPVF